MISIFVMCKIVYKIKRKIETIIKRNAFKSRFQVVDFISYSMLFVCNHWRI